MRMGERRFFIVKDYNDHFIALFKYKEDCENFVDDVNYYYSEIVI